MQTHASGNWADRDAVEAHVKTAYAASLVGVEVRNIVGRHTFHAPEEWVLAFGSMLTWLTNGWWSDETRSAHPMEEVQGLILAHLREKYQGEPWEISWELVCTTARVKE